MLKRSSLLALAMAALLSSPSQAALFTVDALNNSSTGGAALPTIGVTAGQPLSVSVNPNDLWNAGDLPRWSNADGLTANLLATGTDESGQAAATLIGQNWGLWTQSGFTAPYGSLVGEIGGNFQLLGTSFNGLAWSTGTLNLYYWDSFNADNTQFITADVNTVPEPGAFAMLGVSFGLMLAFVVSRRRQRT